MDAANLQQKVSFPFSYGRKFPTETGNQIKANSKTVGIEV